ncbi:MAG: hypothetical protein AAFX87_12155 [Bacteroidota bacterium]
MKNLSAWLAFLAPIFMFVFSILVILQTGFDVTSELDEPPVPLYITPSGYAFIIWQFIYLGFIGLGFYQLRKQVRDDISFVRARKYIIINSLANAAWFVAVLNNKVWITAVLIVVLLLTLIKTAVHLELGKPGADWKEKVFIKLPIALYFGWVTLATPINITSFLLIDVGWTGQALLNPQIWSVIILLVAFGIIAMLYLRRKANGSYLLVGVWGLFAIYIANQNLQNLVGYVALGLAITLVVILLFTRIANGLKYRLL